MAGVKYIFLAFVVTGLLIFGIHYKSEKFRNNIESLQPLSPITKTKNIFAFFNKVKNKPKKIIFGYLPYWSMDKLQYMQLDKLTDIAYFGLYLKEDGTFLTTLEDGTTEPGYNTWHENTDLRDFIKFAKKSGIRISLTVISHDDEISDKVLTCEECWPKIVESLKAELSLHQISDVNMNFEYVEFQDTEMANKYTALVDYINTELDKEYGSSYVTVATFADSFINPRITDVEALGKISDGLFIMAYDFRTRNSANAGPTAPIEGKDVHSSYDLSTMINDYLRVVPPSKIILGVPYYGYNWRVENEDAMAKRVDGDDENGHSESQAFADIMDTIVELKPDLQWDDVSKVPFFTYKSPETEALRQVYFENAESLKFKYDLVDQFALGGVGIWALGYDGGYQELWDLLGARFVQ